MDTADSSPSSVASVFDGLLTHVADACRDVYGARLVSLAVFGSVGRRTPRHDSDIDLLLVVEPLPDGRLARVSEFEAIERKTTPAFAAARARGVTTRLSPVLRTRDEIRSGSPLLLDLTEDARVLVDTGAFLDRALAAFRERLTTLGARRIWRGSAWYWDLKPDYQPGEVFDL